MLQCNLKRKNKELETLICTYIAVFRLHFWTKAPWQHLNREWDIAARCFCLRLQLHRKFVLEWGKNGIFFNVNVWSLILTTCLSVFEINLCTYETKFPFLMISPQTKFVSETQTNTQEVEHFPLKLSSKP